MTYTKIKKFNFTNWQKVPEIITLGKNQNLTNQETHLLGAIKLAYFACEGGRAIIARKSARFLAITTVVVIAIGLISLIGLTMLPSGSIQKTAQAKTFSEKVEFVIESTRSAIIK